MRRRPVPRRVVVIDPGHGGKDSGTIGLHGTYEKTVVLAVGRMLRARLSRLGPYHVVMTRQTDVFLPLAARVAVARKHRAELFISLHANSAPDHQARGASVYTLAWRASDAASAALARQENAADAAGVPHRSGKLPDVVVEILAGLTTKATRLGSARLQRGIITGLDTHVRMLPDPARHARFAVLKAPDVPSVLVEMGFLSNRADEALLRSARHRAVLASAMAGAAHRYLRTSRRGGAMMG